MKTTLTLKKPVRPGEQKPKQPRPEAALIGQTVTIQTKSSTRLKGVVLAFEHGWVTIDGAEYRWLPDHHLSAAIATGRFLIDRQNIAFFAEVSQ